MRHKSCSVWVLDLSQGSAGAPAVLAALTAQERARFERLLMPDAKRRFAMARAGVRAILGGLLGVPAAKVRLAIDASGKPHIRGAGFAFNVTHSGDLALLAVTSERTVGIDLELLRPVSNLEKMLDFACSNRERAAIETAAPGPEREQLFLRTWTKKEAAAKAYGEGLRLDLKSIDTSCGDRVCPDPAGAPGAGFVVVPLDVSAHAVASLALPAHPGRISFYAFDWRGFHAGRAIDPYARQFRGRLFGG